MVHSFDSIKKKTSVNHGYKYNCCLSVRFKKGWYATSSDGRKHLNYFFFSAACL